MGELLSAMDGQSPPPGLLERGAEALRQQVADSPASTEAEGKGAVTAVKIVLPVLVVTAAVSYHFWPEPDSAPRPEPPAEPRSPEPVQAQDPPPKVTAAKVKPVPLRASNEGEQPAVDAGNQRQRGGATGRTARKLKPGSSKRAEDAVALPTSPRPDQKGPPPAAKTSPRSQLPEQIRLFAASRRAAKAGQHARALALIKKLLQRFPATQLRAEAELSRVDLLVRSKKIRSAASHLVKLLKDPRHRGRRSELYCVLGDLKKRSNDCQGATAAYKKALASNPSKREQEAARRGIRACKQ